jgi:hypothetical protein
MTNFREEKRKQRGKKKKQKVMLPKEKRPSTKSRPKHSKTNCDLNLGIRETTTFILVIVKLPEQ